MEIFELERPYKSLGFPHENATTAYFGRNVTKSDLKIVSELLKEVHISSMNTRAFKRDANHFVISVGSIDE